ncbi:hypothetical protein AC1031_008440 [Aphanomyces cochlioides]|nr:hypothetical protein AC1031_008440 [Aphanomyces cochlioides]
MHKIHSDDWVGPRAVALLPWTISWRFFAMLLRYFDSVELLRRWGLSFEDDDKLHRCHCALRIAALKYMEGAPYGLALLVDASNTMEPEELTEYAVKAYQADHVTKVIVAFLSDLPDLVDLENKTVHREHVGKILVCEKAAWGRHLHMGKVNMSKLVISGKFESPRLLYSNTDELIDHMHGGTENADEWFLKEASPDNGWRD